MRGKSPFTPLVVGVLYARMHSTNISLYVYMMHTEAGADQLKQDIAEGTSSMDSKNNAAHERAEI